jgi:rubrerythrin
MAIDDTRWLLSFYRHSEITGAMFFARMARGLRPSALSADLTRHFADEANHARYFSECMDALGMRPYRLKSAYQDRYLEAAGLPVNLMEVLAITQVFEQRVAFTYARHLRAPVEPEVRATLERILADEQWHIRWVRGALRDMEATYTKELVQRTVQRCRAADLAVYRETALEHRQRLGFLLGEAGEDALGETEQTP